jgi:hypothetical protein
MRGSIFGSFSLGKTSPLPLNAGLPDLWRISVILCIGCGVVLPGPVFKVGPPGLFDVYGPLGPASLIVEMVFTAPIYRGYHVTQFLPVISVIVFFAFSLSPIGFVLL